MSGWEKSAVTLAVLLPTAGTVVIALVPRAMDRLVRTLGILFSGAALGVGIAILFGFHYGAHPGLQFELNASYSRETVTLKAGTKMLSATVHWVPCRNPAHRDHPRRRCQRA